MDFIRAIYELSPEIHFGISGSEEVNDEGGFVVEYQRVTYENANFRYQQKPEVFGSGTSITDKVG